MKTDTFEYVDNFKIKVILNNIKFKVKKLEAVENEISSLEKNQKESLESDYKKIENEGIEFVRVKHLQDKIFEIKTNELRSLFKYQKDQIILIGVVFVKKTQKTPKDKIKLALKRLIDNKED